MNRKNLGPYVGVCIVILLIAMNMYGIYQIVISSQSGPLSRQQILYRPEELLRLPQGAGAHPESVPAPFDRPFVIIMGTRSTPVRIMMYNLTFANHSDNGTDVYLSLRAENLGADPVCVFHERDLWFLEATERRLRYDARTVPTLVLQPLEIGYASVKFTINQSVQPSSVVWMIWTGAGWWRLALVVSIS